MNKPRDQRNPVCSDSHTRAIFSTDWCTSLMSGESASVQVVLGQKEVRAMKLSAIQKQWLEHAFKQFEETENSQAFLAAVEKVTGVIAHSAPSSQILRYAESSCTHPHDPENKPIRSDPNLLAACARAFVETVNRF